MENAKSFMRNLKGDFPASIVVFLVALPLCLGVALASNAPLFSGIIAGMVGGMVIGSLSGSQLSVSGPAAGLTAIVAAGIISLGGSFPAFLVSVVIAGVIQLVLGFVKAGVIGDYIPNSVIKGMLAAIGLILILKQLPHLVGYIQASYEGDETFIEAGDRNTFSSIVNAMDHITLAAALIGGLSLLLHILWEKFTAKRKGFIKLIPAPLLIVLLGVAISEYFKRNVGGEYILSPELMVNIPIAKSAGEFLSFFTFPDWSHLANKEVWILAVTLALVASLETLLCVEAIDDLDPYQRVTNKERELKAQGVGNIFSGLIGGLPITSVIVRSSANVNAGAQSRMSTVFHGLLLFLCVAFIPNILNLIPKAALAAILIYTGFKLAKPSLFKMYYKKGWDQFLPFVITITAILFTDLLKGVMVGIAVGLFFILRSNFKRAVFIVNDLNNYLFRLRKDVSFLNKPIIKSKLEEVPENSYVLIDASRADFIDKDVVDVIEDFMIHAPLKNIKVELKRSNYKDQGFNDMLPVKVKEHHHIIRKPETTLEVVED